MYYLLISVVIVQNICYGSGENLILEHIQKAVEDENSTISENCKLHLWTYLTALNNSETWALEMLDSNGRIPSGVMKGNFVDLGFFDECIETSKEVDEGDVINGKYCYAGLAIPLNLDDIIGQNAAEINASKKVSVKIPNILQSDVRSAGNSHPDVSPYWVLATCLPDSCYPSEVFLQLGSDDYCITRRDNSTLDGGDIAFIAFFSITLLFMILSTIYDVYLEKLGKKSLGSIFLAFSLYTNGKKILQASNAPEQILCFNGMKAISLFWVIAGHRYAMYESIGSINPLDAQEWRNRWYAAYILLAPLAVDTFLFITGALLSHMFIKSMSKPNAKFNIVLYYVHRYLRLTPALAAMWFFHVTIVRRIGNGPLWNYLFGMYRTICLDNWWQFFLYIFNYFEEEKRCLFHTWYLAMDMQLYIISPLFLLPLVRFPKLTRIFILPVALAVTITCAMVTVYVFDVRFFSESYDKDYYYMTHNRAGPWLIGIAFGAYVLRGRIDKNAYRISRTVTLLMWCVVLALMATIIFTQKIVISNDDRIESTFYMGLQKSIWALCLCWISFACTYGYGGIIGWFLALPVFQVISKISYSVYLVHVFVVMGGTAQQRVLIYFDDYNGLYVVISDIIVALAIGAFWTLAFESPMITIERLLLGGGDRRSNVKKERTEP